jgi:predicted alpha/beta hydrolase family esterase
MAFDDVRVCILPGWQNSGAAHWQSRWETLHGFERVQQHDWHHPLRGDWMAQLEEAVLASERPLAFVAHSLGCQLVAAWALHSRLAARVRGALLVAPPDTARADMPPQLASWRAVPWQPLPLRAVVLYSDDDPFCSPERARAMAGAWGAPAHSQGARGHLNAESGLGDWPEGLAWLRRAMAA